jgi:radical SAM superfamily enzyme YgiQ (UPF0313 family)
VKILFVYPRFSRHAEHHPELRRWVPMREYLGSPSLGIASIAAVTPGDVEIEFRDDRLADADRPTDADIVALSFFTPAAVRGMQLGDAFRARGHTVVAGGIFPTMMADEVAPHADAVVVGEGEGAWKLLLDDWRAGTLRPRYEAVDADLATLPLPRVDLYIAEEQGSFQPDDYPVQVSRGCPLSCHSCVLPTSMGGASRPLPIDHVLGQMDALAAHGKRACITEDTVWIPGTPGRRAFERLLDRMIAEGRTAAISYIGVSLPMIRASSTALLTKAHAAGVDMFYLVGGFDPITMNAFTRDGAKSWALGLDAVRKAWDHGIEPYMSFLLGNDADDDGTVDRMLEFASAANIRKAEFAIATPYPGTPRWRQLVDQGRILSRDWSRYNDANVVFQPAQMSPDQLQEGYLRLWREFYADRSDLVQLDERERTIQF